MSKIRSLSPIEVMNILQSSRDSRLMLYVANTLDTLRNTNIQVEIVGILRDGNFLVYLTDKNDTFYYAGIKEETKYVPYKDNELPGLKCGDVVVRKLSGIKDIITSTDDREGEHLHVYIREWISNKELFRIYTKLDGTPIGKEV